MTSTFQASSSAQGRAFEEAVQTIIKTGGHEILSTGFTDEKSMEQVDLLVRTANGVEVWIECKGSWNTASKVPGLKRSDTAKKAVANAWHLVETHGDQRPPYILVTSHLPSEGSYSHHLLDDAKAAGLFTDIVIFTSVNDTLDALE